MRLLIIGVANSQINSATAMAEKRGAKVSYASDIETALTSLRSGKSAELIMADVSLDIKKLIDSLVAERIIVPVVGFGLNAKSEDAVRAIKSGAREYIPLPPDEEMIAAVLEAISDENNPLIYKSPQMEKVVQLSAQIAPSEANVLITGESGTGKEMIARYIHNKSKRADNNFISVNCAAIPENLLESEMFGHEKGAFTGAIARRIGKFEEAEGGTLMLDEISEMDTKLQAKLLRAVQEREIDRVGGNKPVKLNIRIIATSNRDLQEEVKNGRFREDLLFRLNIINIHLPPLRERKPDIEFFAKHFIRKYSIANGLPDKALTKPALAILENHAWPGNVRELENTMHRAVLLATSGEIGEEAVMLPGTLKEVKPTSDGNTGLVGRTMESVERELILNTLDHCLGNRTHAANILGISIRTLRNKLKEYGGDKTAA